MAPLALLPLLTAATFQARAVDTTYARLVREATTEERFLPATVAELPWDPTVPSPLDYFGTIAGAEGVVHTAERLYGYYRALAAASPRVAVEKLSTSEGGREIILVVVSDEATIRNLDGVKADMAALADPRVTDEAEMERIVARAKPVYHLEAGQHAAEMGPPEMLPELAYRLAVSESPPARRIRAHVITLLNPVQGPDGRDRQVEWYHRYTQGRPELDDGFPRSSPYWGNYIFHDNNRDGIQMTSALTRASYSMYFEWHPVVMHDLHESVPLLYVSMGTGPYNAHVDPIAVTEWQTMANWDVQQMTRQGVPGVWTWGYYDGWWPGYQTWISTNHNGLGRFFETLGNSGADTYERDLSRSRFSGHPVTSTTWYRAWPPERKILWSLRDNTNLMEAGALASLDYAARNGADMLRSFWRKSRNSLERGTTETPHAFEIPAPGGQRDPRRAAYLLNQLMRYGIEVHRDTHGGDYLVLLNQPYRNFAVDLLTRQDYPEDADFAAPDVAWTLGLIYGVEVREVDDPEVFERPGLERVREPVAWEGEATVARGTGPAAATRWLVEYRGQAELMPALYAMRKRAPGARAFTARQAFDARGGTWQPGTLMVEGLTPADAGVLARDFGLSFVEADAPDVPRDALELPRIAVYHTWFSTQDDGWVRYWFDQLGLPYTSIHKDDLKAGGLRRRFDVILVPNASGSAASWIHGVDRKWGPMPYTATPEYPSHGTPSSTGDMTGGPGFRGMGELEAFLDGGGTLITLGNATRLVAETGIVRQLSSYDAPGLFHPTSVVRAAARRPDDPILYGFPADTYVLRGNGPLWRLGVRDQGSVVLQYGATKGMDSSKPYVLSGMVRNSSRIQGRAAIIDLAAGRDDAGRVVVFTFNPLHRYLNHHDAPMVFNAILHWDRRGGGASSGGGR